jgi:hypothetical protein
VPLRATAYAFGNTSAREVSVLVAAETDLREFLLTPNGGMPIDVLDLRMRVTNPATGEANRYESSIEMKVPPGARLTETAAWYPLSQSFALAAGTYQARIAVRDRNSGKVGAVTHDFEVPVRKGMALSSLIVTDTVERPENASAGPPKPVAIVRRMMPHGATLYYQFAVFDAKRSATGETSVKAGHFVRGPGGGVVKELKPTPLAAGAGGLSRFAGISLAGFDPGDYELVVVVTDEIAGETVTVREPFAIAAP